MDKYGFRQDGTLKGKGFFGELPMSDGSVATEMSMTVDADGKDVDIPLLNPYTTAEDRENILQGNITKEIEEKAVSWAKDRMMQGKSPQAGIGDIRGLSVDMFSKFDAQEAYEAVMSGAVSDKTVDRAYALSEQRNRQLFQELTEGSK